MRIFDNTNQLKRTIIERRLQALDAAATASPYRVEREDHTWCYYVEVESTLTDDQVVACLGPVVQTDVDAEAAEKTCAEKLRTLAEWLRTQSRDVREKFADMQAELDIAKTKWQAEFILLRDWARKKGYPG